MTHNKQLRAITFANAYKPVSMDRAGFKVRATKDLADGDFKTSAIHGSRKLFKGEEMIVDEIFVNAFGLHVRGCNPRGQSINLEPRDLDLVDPDQKLFD